MERFRVKPGSKVELQQWNPADRSARIGAAAAAVTNAARLARYLSIFALFTGRR
jgi:hypothetical protein